LNGDVRNARVIGAVVVVNARHEVLLQLRDDRMDIADPNCWVVPGGGVEPGESPEDGARRELQEETGYLAHTLVPIYADRVVRASGVVEERHFFVTTYDGVQVLRCGEGQAIRFTPRSELQNLRLGTGHMELLERVSDGTPQVDASAVDVISSEHRASDAT
jgi:8-oxo-dGTP diphosphatase